MLLHAAAVQAPAAGVTVGATVGAVVGATVGFGVINGIDVGATVAAGVGVATEPVDTPRSFHKVGVAKGFQFAPTYAVCVTSAE